MVRRFRRMASSDIKAIVCDLDKWANGQLGSKLTWAILEDRFCFSRQALQARSDIKAAYDNAKRSLSGGLIRTKENALKDNKALLMSLERAQQELLEFKRKEKLWMQRWQRIAFHIRHRGLQVCSVDKPISEDGKVPNERETAEILRPFDKEIPSTGRR